MNTWCGCRCRVSVWGVFLLALMLADSCAGAVIELDADRQFEYAQHCFSKGDYLQSAQEFERFVYFFPQDERVARARYQIGMSYFNGNRIKDAINAFDELIRAVDDIRRSYTSYLMLSRCYEALNDSGRAVTVLKNLLTVADDPSIRDEANYRIGWLYIQSGFWQTARQYFDRISPGAADTYRLKRLSSELEKSAQIKHKNPKLAGMLSVIPGAGFAYCERYYDAITAFLLNGGLIFAAYEAFDDGNYALGGVISFVELGFYGGNIYGAVSSAHKYNLERQRQFIETLKQTSGLAFGFSPEHGGICLSFQCRF